MVPHRKSFTNLSQAALNRDLVPQQRSNSLFEGVQTYLTEAYCQKNLAQPRVKGCTKLSAGPYQNETSAQKQQKHSDSWRMPERFTLSIKNSKQNLTRARNGNFAPRRSIS